MCSSANIEVPPAMPDPDPQPPKPRAVSPARWLLLLLPSALVLSAVMIADALEERIEISGWYVDAIPFFIVAVAVTLCFVLGFLLEKWLRGEIKSIVWAINYGFMILFGNGFIFFAAEIGFGFAQLR